MLFLRNRDGRGFTLLELLMVIAVVGILVGLALPGSSSTLYDQLRSAAHVLRTDLAYCRSLAVTYNSNYRITFDTAKNRYVLEHSGGNAALDKLPDSPFRQPDDPPEEHIVDFDELPHVGPPASLAGAASSGGVTEKVADVEFGPLGATTRAAATVVWLSVGSGAEALYLSVSVNPVTGLAEIGQYSKSPPAVLSGN